MIPFTEKEFRFRQAETSESDSLLTLNLTAYAEFETVLAPEHWQVMQANLKDEAMLRSLMSKGITTVCEHEGRMAGVAYLLPSGNPTNLFAADWAYIRLLGVLPEYRGYGLGRALAKECITKARSIGEKTIALHTSEFQAAARHIYEQLGFTVCRALEPTYGKRYWLYTLRL